MSEAKRKDLRLFGIAMGVVLGGIGAWLLGKGRPAAGVPLAGVGLCFLLAATLAPRLLLPLYGPWMKLAFVLGFVMTRVVLTLFFFVAITPVGLIRRLLGHDSLDRRPAREARSAWRERSPEPPPRERYERQF